MTERVLIAIPARLGSSRFPDKPLVSVCGHPLVRCTYERARMASFLLGRDGLAVGVSVVTPDREIADFCNSAGIRCDFIDEAARNGTERVYQLFMRRRRSNNEPEVVVNWQVDEPLVSPEDVARLVRLSADNGAIMTLVQALTEDERTDANVVKAIAGPQEMSDPDSPMTCHWFTRTYLPGSWAHVGVYAFRSYILEHIATRPRSPYDVLENLEQLSWMGPDENGFQFNTMAIVTSIRTIGVNIPSDVQKVELALGCRNSK